MDRKTRKIITLNGYFHSRISVASLYIKRKGGRGLISVEDCITTERRGSYDYLNESKQGMLRGEVKENVIERQRSNLQKGKGMKEIRLCMKKVTRTICREDQEHCTRVFRKDDKECVFEERDRGHVIFSSRVSTKKQFNQSKHRQKTSFPKCRLYVTKEETVTHLVSGCPKLVQKQYKRRHDNGTRRVHSELCKKHTPES